VLTVKYRKDKKTSYLQKRTHLSKVSNQKATIKRASNMKRKSNNTFISIENNLYDKQCIINQKKSNELEKNCISTFEISVKRTLPMVILALLIANILNEVFLVTFSVTYSSHFSPSFVLKLEKNFLNSFNIYC
jgi:hypothetical protein